MLVTAIKEQLKNPERVSVFVDGSFCFSLTLTQLLQSGLKKGQDIAAIDIAHYKELSAQGKRFAKLLNWITLRPRSSGEVRRYILLQLEKNTLKRPGEDEQHQLFERVERAGYVDDDRFVEWWLSRRASQKKSPRVLAAELVSKGVDRRLIDSRLAGESGQGALINQVHTLMTRQRYRGDRQKLIQALVRKGFRYSDIVAVLDADDA